MKWSWYPEEFSVLYVILVIFLIAAAIQLYYYLLVFSRMLRKRKPIQDPIQRPISVVICARNEEENLRRHLPAILSQDYPHFEVVVVNHASVDGSQDFLDSLKPLHPHLKVVVIREDNNLSLGKKYPLTMGLKGASHDHVLLTDADCFPVTKDWISTMAANFTENTHIVLGYGGFVKEKGFLNKLIRYDAFYIALQYFAFALDKMPYMGVGRNLAYRKDIFFINKGFGKHYMLPSGDDDLFINRVATWHNTVIETSRTSHTRSIARKSLGSWFRQKKRHLTTGRYYKPKNKFHLTLLFLSSWIFMVFFLVLIGFSYIPYLIVPVFLLRITIQLFIFKHSMSRLDEKDLLGGALIFELILLFLYPFLTLSARFSKLRKWN